MDPDTGILYADDTPEILNPLKKFALAFRASLRNPDWNCSGSIRVTSGFFRQIT
jgi:hypothetical protein